MSGEEGSANRSDQAPSTHQAAVPAELVIERGTCHVLFAYDVGFSVDLADAERRIAALTQRGSFRKSPRAPRFFEYQPAPLRVTQRITPVPIGAFETAATADIVIYDFGAVCVAYAIPLTGGLTELRALGAALFDHVQLEEHSRAGVAALLQTISPAVSKLGISHAIEDYVIYQVDALRPARPPRELVAEHATWFAQVLRGEDAPLSRQETEDALAFQLSFRPQDLTVIDWNAALLFDPDPEDVRTVLEFANVEALELRFLDDRLDLALNQAYSALARRRRWGRTVGGRATDLRRIAQLQMDAAVLFEGVNNPLKLLGDQYLARVYRAASQRFHLADWDASILRKLQTIESLYDKISDRHANRRMEVLEWIIILLIAVEIVLSLVRSLEPS